MNLTRTTEPQAADASQVLRSRTRREMVEAFSRLSQVLGLARSLGQIYGLLYLSPTPLSLDDMVDLLGISKASASTSTRQLVAWGALRQVWVPGERRDFFEAVADFGNLVRGAYTSIFKPRLESSARRLESLQASLEEDFRRDALTEQDYRFCAERLKQLSKAQKKAQGLSPFIERLL
jgi:DNA-binding transcriptional regulator GbsR (MarR family)